MNPASPSVAATRLDAALQRRAKLLADPRTTACRVLHGAADGLDGLVLEKFGDVLIAQTHEDRLALAEDAIRHLCETAVRRLGGRAVYRKIFAKDRSAALTAVEALHTSATPWLGEPVEPEFPVLENGVRFLIRPYDGYSVGLFLEHRGTRAKIRELARGRRVLNTFAYTCGFSIAAALGGAAETVSVDVSRKFLEWGKRNFTANQVDLSGHFFIASDVFDYYKRAARQGRRFDLIILDPPTFARIKQSKSVFALAEDLDRLVKGAAELLEPGGRLLLATNHRGLSFRRLEQAVAQAAPPRRFEILERPALPPDFHGDPDYSKSLWVEMR